MSKISFISITDPVNYADPAQLARSGSLVPPSFSSTSSSNSSSSSSSINEQSKPPATLACTEIVRPKNRMDSAPTNETIILVPNAPFASARELLRFSNQPAPALKGLSISLVPVGSTTNSSAINSSAISSSAINISKKRLPATPPSPDLIRYKYQFESTSILEDDDPFEPTTELVKHKHLPDPALPLALTLAQFRHATSQSINLVPGSRTVYSSASSSKRPAYHWFLVKSARANPRGGFSVTGYPIVSYSSPPHAYADGASCQWDSEQWLQSMPAEFRDNNVPVPAKLAPENGVAARHWPSPQIRFLGGFCSARKCWLLKNETTFEYSDKWQVGDSEQPWYRKWRC